MKVLATQLLADKRRKKSLLEMPGPGRPSSNQIMTRTLCTGVTNGSERNDLVKGNYAHADDVLPAPWGYQNVGKVIEIGAAVSTVNVGDVVYSSSDHTEYALFDEDFLYCRLPPDVDPREAALFGMTSVAMRTCRHADIRMGERVLVIGGGIIGHSAVQIANVMGARVTVCDVDQQRLELARQIGAAETIIDVSGEGWNQEIQDFTYDVIIDVAGVPDGIDNMVRAAVLRGRIMLIAGRNKVTYDFNTGQGHEITIKQNSHFDNSDLANLCRLVAKGQVVLRPYLKDVVPVENAEAIYNTLRDNPQELFGTVFEW